MKRPNVLLLYTDQQRWDTLRYGGNTHIHTPNLDRLAQGGALLENAFCNNPVCMPSRQSMLSGLYPSTVGCMTNGVEMREDVWTLPKILKAYSYHTANIGKLHFKNHANRDHREPHPRYGFDTLILSDEPGCYEDAYIKWVAEHDPAQVENCRVSTPPAWGGAPVHKQPRNTHEPYIFEGPEHLTHTAFVADETIEYLKQRAHTEQPFFAIAGFYAPHPPLNPPTRFVELYDPASLPLPYQDDDSNVPWQGRNLTDAHWRKVKAYYYALISHVDEQVGRILEYVDASGMRDNTLIIFTSDHGEHLGDHGLIQKGPPGLDSCIHVPLLVAAPGVVQGQRHAALIEAVDIAPTILDFCGVQSPPAFQGRSFRQLLMGDDYEPRTSVYVEHKEPFRSSWKTVRTEAFKYCISGAGVELLFDLCNDPHEQRNVISAPAYRDVLAMMRHELVQRWFTVENQYPLRSGRY